MFSIRKSIGTRLSLSVLSAVVIVMGAGTALVSWQVWSQARDNANGQAARFVEQAASVFAAYDGNARDNAQKEFGLFKSRMDGSYRLETGGAEPVLLLNDRPLNGQFDLVDAFTRETKGGVATVFARDGDDYLRVTTSLLNAKGERAFRTKLDRKHPAYALMGEGKPFIGRATLFGKDYMTVYEPIQVNGKTIGILFTGTDMTALLGTLSNSLLTMHHGDTGAVYAIDIRPGATQGKYFGMREGVKPLDPESQDAKDWIATVSEAKETRHFELQGSPLDAAQAPQQRLLAVKRFDPWGLAIVADAPIAELTRAASHTLTTLWTMIAVGIAVIAAMLVFSSRRLVVRPLRQLSHSLGTLAAGDLRQPIARTSNDEIGALCGDMEQFRSQLADSLRAVGEGALQVSDASREISAGNQDLSSRTEAQASSLEETASAMEEIAQTVHQNAENARAANELSQGAANVAAQGGQVVGEVVETMKEIHASGQRIAEIISVIDSIAFQTNILALNAAVEAARAGEQGRGFAVVAGEVRSLAGRSAEAASQIRSLIGDSVQRIDAGTVLVDRARSTMSEVVDSVQRVTALIGEISAASAEQSAGIEQVGMAVGQMDKATQQNAALVEEIAASSHALKDQADSLNQSVGFFRV